MAGQARRALQELLNEFDALQRRLEKAQQPPSIPEREQAFYDWMNRDHPDFASAHAFRQWMQTAWLAAVDWTMARTAGIG